MELHTVLTVEELNRIHTTNKVLNDSLLVDKVYF